MKDFLAKEPIYNSKVDKREVIIMDIAAMSMISSQSNVATSASIDLTKMAIDTQTQSGQKIAEMLSQPQNPNIGTSLDVRV